jgi:hypothetical protein
MNWGMNRRQTRFERSAEGSFPYWVCLIEERCTGANYEKVREFCRANGLTLSRNIPWFEKRSGTKFSVLLTSSTPKFHERVWRRAV